MFKPIYENIEEAIRGMFPDVAIHRKFPANEKLVLPCFIVECVFFDPAKRLASGELKLSTRWEIRHQFEVTKKTVEPEIAARNTAARLALALDRKRLTPNSDVAQYLNSFDDDFDRQEPGVESWVSEFNIDITVGENLWDEHDSYSENDLEGTYCKTDSDEDLSFELDFYPNKKNDAVADKGEGSKEKHKGKSKQG